MRALVRIKPWEVSARLAELNLTREDLLETVDACVAAQNSCTENDPPNARGFESWRWGVRRVREVLCPQGWLKDDTGMYCTVVNPKRKIRLAILNADDGVGIPDRTPQNRNRKGPTSERVASDNSRQIAFTESSDWPVPETSAPEFSDFQTWHLCVYIQGDIVRAELSLLDEFCSGYFTGCSEKIILLGEGDYKPEGWKTNEDDDDGPEFTVQVTRK